MAKVSTPANAPSNLPASAASADGPASCTSATQVRVGYETSLAFLQDSPDAPKTRFQALLEETFPSSQFHIVYKDYFREDIALNVSAGAIDIGVMAVDAKRTVPLSGTQPLGSTESGGLQALALPVGYTVMAETPMANGDTSVSQAPLWLLVPIALALVVGLSATALATVTFALNFNLPIWRRRTPSAATRIDPALSQWTRAWRWMVTTVDGGIFTAVWCLVGLAVALQHITGRSGVDTRGAARKADAIARMGSLLPVGRNIYEYTGEWRKCDRSSACLRDYESNEQRALILGDDEHLCHYAASVGLESRLHFATDVVVPQTYALLLPATGCIGDQFRSTLRRWHAPLRPLTACPTNAEGSQWPFASR